jgi:hypothetical protein
MTLRIATAGAGNWSSNVNNAPWPGGIVPMTGTPVQIGHAVTMDTDRTVGESKTIAEPLTGTCATTGGGNVTVVGTGTLFLTEVNVGDTITIPGAITEGLVNSITDNTHLDMTVYANATVSGVSGCTVRPCALYVKGSGTATLLTIAAGKELTLKGDVSVRQANPIMQAGAKIKFDSSAATGTPMYAVNLCAGGQNVYTARLISILNTASTRGKISRATLSGNWMIRDMGGSSGVNFSYMDLEDAGSASVKGIELYPSGTAITTPVKFNNCRFTRCYDFRTLTLSLAADVQIIGCEEIETPANSVGRFEFNTVAGTPTGLRVVQRNVLYDPLKAVYFTINTSAKAFTIEDNVFGVVNTPTAGVMTSFARNIWPLRNCGNNGATNWSFVGIGGDTIRECDFINDEGPSQATQHELMSNDQPPGGGTFNYQDCHHEHITPPVGGVNDIVHLPGATGATFTLRATGMISPPNSRGEANGQIRARGNAQTVLEVEHCTLMTDQTAIPTGSEYAGFAGMVNKIRDCLFWRKQSATGTGYASVYGNTVANVLNAANVSNNAHYNGTVGTLYDAAGANGTPALGFHNYRQATKPTLAADVNLGTGTNEMTQGPRFVDTTRNFATFSIAYLRSPVGTPWADATAYAIGDIRSAQSTTFYGNTVINFRCVVAHTSSAASSTLGQPGSATTDVAVGYPSGYRQYWEFESSYLIREHIKAGTLFTDASIGVTAQYVIKTFHEWVRAGFRPQNSALATSASDGTFIGAMDYLPPSLTGDPRRRARIALSMRRS